MTEQKRSVLTLKRRTD
ncbi:hypothetical protein ACLILA_005363, partial [Escherichia coli]|nr:hypothetical protein [Escherichia coli]HCP8839943.1 hypothetical protein [Escherichia coli]